MSPITFDEAYAATDPSLSEDQRKASAEAIQNGVAANEVYWNHRDRLEALEAQATGHSIVSRGSDETPTEVGSGTASGEVIDATAEEEPATALGTGASATADGGASPASGTPPVPSPDNPNDAIAKLRAQVQSLGGSPEA